MPALRPLRLLTVTNYFPAHGGGIERVAERLITEFGKQQVVVDWISSDTDPPPESTCSRVVVPVRTFNVVERWTQLPYPIWSLSALPLLWRAIGRSEVVHVHEHLYFGSILSVLMARLRHRPVVVTQHMGALGLQSPSLTTLYEFATRILGRVIFCFATRIVFISANVRSFFSRDSCSKTSLIFNGIEPGLFEAPSQTQRRALRIRLGLSPERRVVLFVGRFVRKKGLRILELLTSRFPEVLWVFAGSGPEDPSTWRRDNVLVLGSLDHSSLAGVYQAADLLILPSSGEGFPLVVQEALSCGLGVLSTEEVGNACPAAADMIRMRPTPRLEADVDGWETALRQALQDRAYLEGRFDRARRAHELWSWERCATEYLRLFAEIAD